MPDRKKKLYIETVGCQMNVLDSELVVGKLRREGYELTDDIEQADTILYNTCSVRQHAEDKTYTPSAASASSRRPSPSVAVGVLGCMAQKDQGRSSGGPPTSTSWSDPGSSARSRNSGRSPRRRASRSWPSACRGPPAGATA